MNIDKYVPEKTVKSLERFGENLEKLSLAGAKELKQAIERCLKEKMHLDAAIREMNRELFPSIDLDEVAWQVRQSDLDEKEMSGLLDFLEEQLEENEGRWFQEQVATFANQLGGELLPLESGKAALHFLDDKPSVRGSYKYLAAILERIDDKKVVPNLDSQSMAIDQLTASIQKVKSLMCELFLSPANSSLPIASAEWQAWNREVAVFANAIEEFQELLRERFANVKWDNQKAEPLEIKMAILDRVEKLSQLGQSSEHYSGCLFEIGKLLNMLGKLELDRGSISLEKSLISRRQIYGVLVSFGFVEPKVIDEIEKVLWPAEPFLWRKWFGHLTL
ncbi:MAG: hypothetical protein F6J93_38160 [Oscillatoria sp. SIO1A7]|nr:hypothetical protein [Oscillatoria sp. SIO1A7]